jgi:methyl-accepting chemotaxis protein
MAIQNWKISVKLFLAFAVVIVTSALISTKIFLNIQNIEATSASANGLAGTITKTNALSKAMVDLSGEISCYLLTGDEAFAHAFDDRKLEIAKTLQQLGGMVASAEERAAIEGLSRAAENFISHAGEPELRLGHDPATREQATGLLRSGENAKWMNAFKVAIAAFLEHENDTRNARIAARDGAFADARVTLLIGAAIALAVAGLAGWLLFRQIAVPIVAMTAAMRRLASGDNQVAIPAAQRRDELGEMATAVQFFRDAAVEKLHLESEASEQRRAAEGARASGEAQRAAAAAAQARVMAALASGLDQLAQGQLLFRITEPFAAGYEKLRVDFNGAMDQLQQAMLAISGNTLAITSGTQEITAATQDLSRRTEQQAASLEETAASLDEITATVKKTAEGAKHTQQAVAAARGEAEKSGEVVRLAMQAMGGIERSSNQIGQIIGVIDEIAFQTNLLALNAGVEAARAGDAGRGFAVVASEVRALAQRSAEAAKEIKQLISTSTAQVDQGVELVAQTGRALERIVAQVAAITSEVSGIAASAIEQSTALQQVNTAINEMDRVTQQNAAMVEETTAAAHSLSQASGELGHSVGRFQVAEGSTVRKDTPRMGPRPAAPVPRGLMARGGAAAAARAAPDASEQSWEEF